MSDLFCCRCQLRVPSIGARLPPEDCSAIPRCSIPKGETRCPGAKKRAEQRAANVRAS